MPIFKPLAISVFELSEKNMRGAVSAPPAISRTDGRRETGEAAFERSHREASRSLIKFYFQGHRSGQGQVKGKNAGFHTSGF